MSFSLRLMQLAACEILFHLFFQASNTFAKPEVIQASQCVPRKGVRVTQYRPCVHGGQRKLGEGPNG